LSLVGLFN